MSIDMQYYMQDKEQKSNINITPHYYWLLIFYLLVIYTILLFYKIIVLLFLLKNNGIMNFENIWNISCNNVKFYYEIM